MKRPRPIPISFKPLYEGVTFVLKGLDGHIIEDKIFPRCSDFSKTIALRTFVNAEDKPYQFSTVCDDIAFLMIEQYEKLGKNKPHEVKLLRSTAKKGQAALFLVIANIFQDKLDEAILGAVQGAYDYLLVAADLIGGMSGEDLEIQVELSTLHMDSINQLIKYAKMGECDNIPELNRIASEAHDKELHICSYAPNSQ